MLTFNQERKNDLISKLDAHAKADAFIQGIYWNNGKGCAVGCTLHDYDVDPEDHSQYEKLFGIPQIIARLEDRIFEGLSIKDAKKWPFRFTNSVPITTDLSGVWPKFAIAILVDPDHGVIRHAKTDEQRVAIQRVADLYMNDGSVEEFREAKSAAHAAAAHAAAAAAAAAGAGARKSHYQWMADKFIELLKAA